MKEGQPALVYLVPCTLLTVIIISLIRKEFCNLWHGTYVSLCYCLCCQIIHKFSSKLTSNTRPMILLMTRTCFIFSWRVIPLFSRW